MWVNPWYHPPFPLKGFLTEHLILQTNRESLKGNSYIKEKGKTFLFFYASHCRVSLQKAPACIDILVSFFPSSWLPLVPEENNGRAVSAEGISSTILGNAAISTEPFACPLILWLQSLFPRDCWPWKTPGLQWHRWEAQGHLTRPRILSCCIQKVLLGDLTDSNSSKGQRFIGNKLFFQPS